MLVESNNTQTNYFVETVSCFPKESGLPQCCPQLNVLLQILLHISDSLACDEQRLSNGIGLTSYTKILAEVNKFDIFLIQSLTKY